MKNIVDYLESSENLAIVEAGRSITFDSLKRLYQKLAFKLNMEGVGPGTRVLFALKPGIELYAHMLACLRLGAEIIFIDPSYSPDQIIHCLKLAKPQVVLLDPALFAPLVKPLGWLLKVLKRPKILTLPLPESDRYDETASGSWPVGQVGGLITFTSGSTGRPRGIMRNQQFLAGQAQRIKTELSVGNYQSELLTLPIFVLSNLAQGVTSYLTAPVAGEQNIESIDLLLKAMPARILAAPAFLNGLADAMNKDNYCFSFVREIRTGGGPVLPHLIEKLQKAFPQARIWSIYGSTEAEPVAAMEITNALLSRLKSEAARGRGLLQGRFNDGTTLVIADPSKLTARMTAENFAAALTNGEAVGEILVAGEHVVQGYLDGIGDCENKVRVDGGCRYHRTGDAGFLDEDGLLHLCGRIGQAIELPENAGARIYPLQVEALADEKAAFLEVGGERILVLEGKNGESDKDGYKYRILQNKIAALGEKLVGGKPLVHRIIQHSIPVDKRHHSKVLYAKLRSQLYWSLTVRRN